MKEITLTDNELESLDWVIDFLNFRDSLVVEEVLDDYGMDNPIDPIGDLCNIYNRSLG